MPRGGALRSVLRFKPIERDPDKRRLAHVASVDDLRRIAHRRLPRGVFGYVDGGAEDELTLRRNVDGFAALEFRPRVLRDVGKIDTSCSLFGRPLPLPLILAPTGFTRIVAPDGELAVARAAAAAGPAVHVVDHEHVFDRAGGGGLRWTEVVPGLRVA